MEDEAKYSVPTEASSYMALRKLDIGTTKFTEVFSCDEKGIGGAHHVYMVKKAPEPGDKKNGDVMAMILFQKGALKVEGLNGIFIEDLLAIVIDRLQCFQAGDFRCDENEFALCSILVAQAYLKARTLRREAKGILGTHIVG